MKILDDIDFQEVINPNLLNGYLSEPIAWASPEAYATIDNVTKFALDDSDFEEVQLYHRWTEEEIAEREEQLRIQKEQEQREQMLEYLPDNLASLDEAICTLYELTL